MFELRKIKNCQSARHKKRRVLSSVVRKSRRRTIREYVLPYPAQVNLLSSGLGLIKTTLGAAAGLAAMRFLGPIAGPMVAQGATQMLDQALPGGGQPVNANGWVLSGISGLR